MFPSLQEFRNKLPSHHYRIDIVLLASLNFPSLSYDSRFLGSYPSPTNAHLPKTSQPQTPHMMAESTSAERLDYLLEMALTIHEGIVEHVESDDELDKQLIAHLKELDHFIVVKKALQGRYVNQPCSSDDELAAGGSTPPPSHQAPSTAAHAKKHSISPQSQHSSPSPSLFFSSPEPQGTRTSAPARRKASRRIQGETKGSKALRKMRNAVPYASWVDKPK